jgi:hypothetical protein
MKTMLRGLIASGLLAFLFVSCQKDQDPITDPTEKEEFATISSESDAEAELAFNEVFDNAIGVNAEVGIGGTGVFTGTLHPSHNIGEIVGGAAGIDSVHCFTVTATNLNQGAVFPLQIIIDFGTGCTGRDGKLRTGKIITEYSNRLISPGATATTTFDGYSVNGVQVQGTHTITNKSTANSRAFEIDVDGKLLKSNGNFVQWKSHKAIEQTAGLGTPFAPGDDIFEVTGEASGTAKRGEKLLEWNTAISSPLIKKFSCRYIVGGVLDIRKGSTVVASLDYGDGGCDNKATLTIGAHTRIISLD